MLAEKWSFAFPTQDRESEVVENLSELFSNPFTQVPTHARPCWVSAFLWCKATKCPSLKVSNKKRRVISGTE
jgi:hypothetical protein